MTRLLPRSLAGQMTLLLGLALLVAQLVNLGLILNERQKLSLAQNEAPAITRFADLAADLAQAAPEFRGPILADNSHRGARFAVQADSGIPDNARSGATEERLSRALAQNGRPAPTVRAGLDTSPARADRPVRQGRPNASARQDGPRGDTQFLRLAVRQPDGRWLVGRMATPRRDPWFAARLAAATLLLYLIVLGATVWMARRIARPLHNLTRAAERFRGRSDPEPVIAGGPDDLRLAIEAFNAMNARVVGLLDEKDRMLGAIGHDLRTPLASLRIRVESMEPDGEREAAVAKIEEMASMLEDILVLARSGRVREQSRPVDATALAEAVVEEYRAQGEPVRFAPSPRAVLQVQSTLLRRALRNLIDNAVAYGGGAEVVLIARDDGVELRISDTGPGIAPDQMEQALIPFHRLEQSRNRATGGSGLGLAIAKSVAESHGGRLTLAQNRPTGLIAAIFLPRAPEQADGARD
ncbi:MAG: hypothetical protein JWM75_1241 [Sphingomonas bacterium]|nr:hypothetical protein [Sphingomonas bacterium]